MILPNDSLSKTKYKQHLKFAKSKQEAWRRELHQDVGINRMLNTWGDDINTL